MSVDPTDLGRRDPDRIGRLFPYVSALYDRYFRCEIDGLDNLPGREPAIYFGNHCGSTVTIEGTLLTVALLRRFGLDHKLYFMAHRAFFDVPWLSEFLLEIGSVLADRDVARRILRGGGQFVTFPGGDRDSHKPFRDRHTVNFFGHTGFIRMSLEERVPLVPFVHVGTHETVYVISRGERLAKFLRLGKLTQLNVCPVVLSLPLGLTVGPYYLALPLPSKIKMKVLPPVRLWERGWTDPNDPDHLEQSLAFLTAETQRELTALARARRLPVLG